VTRVREQPAVAALVEQIIREARPASAAAREDLRRELLTHFAEVGDSPEALRAALARFGNASNVAKGLRRAYGPGRLFLYGARIAGSILVSIIVALGIQAAVNLRVEPGTGAVLLGPWFGTSALISIGLVVAAAAAWELSIEPLCTRLERRPLRLLIIFGAFATAAYLTHLIIDRIVEPAHALLGSAATIAVWVLTIAVLARVELAFIRRFGAN